MVKQLSEEKTVREHEGLISWWATRFQRSCSWELEDLKQEATIAFLRALRSWDPTKGCSLKTHASNYIKQDLLKIVRTEKLKRRTPTGVEIRLEDLQYTHDPDAKQNHDIVGAVDPGFEKLEKRELHAFVKREMMALKPRTRALIKERVEESLTLQEVGDKHKITKERVRQIVGQALPKVRQRVEAAIR